MNEEGRSKGFGFVCFSFPEDGQHEDATDGRQAADGHGRPLHAHGAPAPALLHPGPNPCSTPKPQTTAAAAAPTTAAATTIAAAAATTAAAAAATTAAATTTTASAIQTGAAHRPFHHDHHSLGRYLHPDHHVRRWHFHHGHQLC